MQYLHANYRFLLVALSILIFGLVPQAFAVNYTGCFGQTVVYVGNTLKCNQFAVTVDNVIEANYPANNGSAVLSVSYDNVNLVSNTAIPVNYNIHHAVLNVTYNGTTLGIWLNSIVWNSNSLQSDAWLALVPTEPTMVLTVQGNNSQGTVFGPLDYYENNNTCHSSSCKFNITAYPPASVDIAAAPLNGYKFVGWQCSGTGCSSSNGYSGSDQYPVFNITSSITETASFSANHTSTSSTSTSSTTTISSESGTVPTTTVSPYNCENFSGASLSVSNLTLRLDQAENLTAHISGGTPPYDYIFTLHSASSNSLVEDLAYDPGCYSSMQSNSQSCYFTYSNATFVGNVVFYVLIGDSSNLKGHNYDNICDLSTNGMVAAAQTTTTYASTTASTTTISPTTSTVASTTVPITTIGSTTTIPQTNSIQNAWNSIVSFFSNLFHWL